MNPDNLTAVYNQNPTIQSMYTLPEYLSLFGQGTYTPIQPTPTDPTPTDPTPEPGIPSIINQNLNQGGGEGDGPQDIANVPGTYGKEYTGQTMPDGTPIGSTVQVSGLGIFDSLKKTGEDLVDLYKTYSPIGFIGRKITEAKKNKIAREKAAFDKAEKERIAKETIAKAAERQAEADRIRNTYQRQQQQIRDAGEGRGSRQGDSDISDADRGGFATDDTAGFFARGGRVRKSYFNGGIVSLRRR